MTIDEIAGPRRFWKRAIDWIKESGWPTRDQDQVIADGVYTAWILATNADCLTTGYRDRGALSDALENAFRPIRDDRAADSLVILYQFLLEIRGRREGALQQHRNH
jgi:hypothetical protein